MNSGKYREAKIYAQVEIITSWNNVTIVMSENESTLIQDTTQLNEYVT